MPSMYGRVLSAAEVATCRGKIDPWWPVHGGVSGVMEGRGITPSQVVSRAVVDGRVYVGTVSGSVYELGEMRR